MFDKNMCDDTFIMTFHQFPGKEKVEKNKGFSITAENQPFSSLHIRTYSILARFPGPRTMWSETPISNDYLTCFYE